MNIYKDEIGRIISEHELTIDELKKRIKAHEDIVEELKEKFEELPEL